MIQFFPLQSMSLFNFVQIKLNQITFICSKPNYKIRKTKNNTTGWLRDREGLKKTLIHVPSPAKKVTRVLYTFCTMSARARWAFCVSQGSVETLFRRGRKRLHDFAEIFFRKLSTKYHKNRRSFVENISILQKKHFGFFVPNTLYINYKMHFIVL